jgi:predicted esterase
VSATLPPAAKLLEIDEPAAVLVDRLEGGAHLGGAEADAQRVEQPAQLGLVDLPIFVPVEAIEAVSQGIGGHCSKLRRFWSRTNGALLLGATLALAPLESLWLERLGEGDDSTVVTPPVGATSPRPLVLGVHGAGDRPEWSCGGWRLASQVSAFVACPRGSPHGDRFAWASSRQLGQRVEAAVNRTRARFGAYVDPGPMIFAGFSQGATLAEPLLREQAARFPIAILAEGGYQTANSKAFARAYREAGGRRVVLVCGTPPCFRSARSAMKVLMGAGLETLVVGDEKAGHNLNQRMQQALQAAWPQIVAPLPGSEQTEHSH